MSTVLKDSFTVACLALATYCLFASWSTERWGRRARHSVAESDPLDLDLGPDPDPVSVPAPDPDLEAANQPRPPALQRASHIRRPSRNTQPRSRQTRGSSIAVTTTTNGGDGSSGGQGGGSTGNDWEQPLDPAEDRHILKFLRAIADDQRRREAYVHRGITCNHCQTSPICGIRYRCTNCPDFDLCENCECENTHFPHHIFIKIRVPIPIMASPRAPLCSSFYPGKLTGQRVLTWLEIQYVQNLTKMNKYEVDALYEQFKLLATDHGDLEAIDEDTYYKCLGPCVVGRPLITKRIFQLYDRDQDGLLSFEEMAYAVYFGTKAPVPERLPLIFKCYDIDGDNYIGRSDLTKIFESFLDVHITTLRDVIISMDQNALDSSRILPGQPMSAAYSVAIPPHLEHLRHSTDVEDVADELNSPRFGRPQPPQVVPTSTTTPASATDPLAYEADYNQANAHWPIMESLNHSAIEQLVDETFNNIRPKRKNHIAYEEFVKYCNREKRLVLWLDVIACPF